MKWSRQFDECIICGSTDHKHKSKGYCVKCYPAHKHEIMPISLCGKCDREAKGYMDRGTGNFICLSCRASKIKPCYICRKDKKPDSKIGNGVYVCAVCSKHIAQGKCSHCGNKGNVITQRATPPICHACDTRKPAACSICHSVVKFYIKNENGTVMCRKCYTPAPKPCIVCGRVKTPHQKTSQGHICEDCYQRPLRECSGCGNHRQGYKKTEVGKYLCRDCYYSGLLPEAVEAVKGKFTAEWAESLFLDYIEDKKRIQSNNIVFNAVRRDKPLFDMLGRDFTALSEITGASFWKEYHRLGRKRTGQLYAFLIDRGLIELPAEESESYRTHYRILSHIEALPDGFKPLAHIYYESHLTIRDKKLSAGWKDTDYGTGAYSTMESGMIILKEFVAYLSESGVKAFSEVNAYHVDDYMASHYTYAATIRKFILWLYQEQQLAWKYRGKWKYPKYSTPRPIHDERYEYLVERFLDESYPLKESLICLLALVYGIRPKVLRKIRIYDLHEKADKLYLKLPYFEIEVHSKLAEMLRRYLQDSFLPNPFDADNPYLFYGYTYKEPMADGSIRNILRKHGIKTHQILSTVIHRLFNDKVRHPAIISKVTGVHKATAVRYFESYNPSVLEEINLNRALYGNINKR